MTCIARWCTSRCSPEPRYLLAAAGEVIGIMCLEAVGLPQLIAESWDDYVAKAVALAADIPALAALRAKVRPGFDASAYRDEIGFTRRLEAAFRAMFAQKQAARAAV